MFKDPKGGRPSLWEYIVAMIVIALILVLLIVAFNPALDAIQTAPIKNL